MLLCASSSLLLLGSVGEAETNYVRSSPCVSAFSKQWFILLLSDTENQHPGAAEGDFGGRRTCVLHVEPAHVPGKLAANGQLSSQFQEAKCPFSLDGMPNTLQKESH